MVNIFIDSTVLYKDPFWTQNFGKILLELGTKSEGISIYISSVVLDETLNNFKKRLKSLSDRVNKDIREFNSIVSDSHNLSLGLRDQKSYLKSLEEFYDESFSKGAFVRIPLNNKILPELVNRAIKRREPFFTENKNKKKQEFRDAVIWLCYTEFIKENQLANCFFISGNKGDFWDNENSELHPDLAKDCEGIKIYDSLRDLILREEKVLKIKGRQEFQEWFKKQNLDAKKISLYLRSVWGSFIKKLEDSVDYTKPFKYFDDEKISWFELFSFEEDFELKNYHISVIEDSAFINMTIVLDSSSKIYKLEFFDPELRKVAPLVYFNQISCDLTLKVRKEETITIEDLKVTKITLVDELF